MSHATKHNICVHDTPCIDNSHHPAWPHKESMAWSKSVYHAYGEKNMGTGHVLEYSFFNIGQIPCATCTMINGATYYYLTIGIMQRM